ncbi:hypothetical protein [Kosakonia sp. R1.Fl]|uniref:hypothetical protein n=1 Tax=Kosakonia sp. R1.Fl TaxID=2928706 RepID=UPI00201E6771|nr:hypothetical protein [Kosakonia sp. R1.Fl]MCL6742280.1 hypothetical protein [Kosakonia sp. R1.Fl]
MQNNLEQATHFVIQLQQAHRIVAAFYQRILPLFDNLASQAMDADFWYWYPSETSRPCRTFTRPSSSWAWDFLPIFASEHAYKNWDSDTTKKGDETLVFRLWVDDDFRFSSPLRAGKKSQPNPLQLDGQGIVEVILVRSLEDSERDFDNLWNDMPWPALQPEWKQNEVCNLLEVCSKHVSLALLLTEPDDVVQWIKEMNRV